MNTMQQSINDDRGGGVATLFHDMLSLSHSPQIMVECAGVTLC